VLGRLNDGVETRHEPSISATPEHVNLVPEILPEQPRFR
jgi:hypothetical protein